MSARPNTCPRCREDLSSTTYRGVDIEECTGCRGFWIPGPNVALLFPARDERALLFELAEGESKLDCPTCQESVMERVTHVDAAGIFLDACATCDGLWLDAFEAPALEKALGVSGPVVQTEVEVLTLPTDPLTASVASPVIGAVSPVVSAAPLDVGATPLAVGAAPLVATSPTPAPRRARVKRPPRRKRTLDDDVYGDSFWRNLVEVLKLPFSPVRLIVMVIVSVGLTLLLFVPLGALFRFGLGLYILTQVLIQGAQGQKAGFDMEGFEGVFDSLIVPAIRLVAGLAFVLGPPLALAISLDVFETDTLTIPMLAALGWAAPTLPAMFIILGLGQGLLDMVNPVRYFQVLTARPGQYLVASVLFYALVVGGEVTLAMLSDALPLYGDFLGLALSFVLSVMAFQLLGVFAHCNWTRLNR